MYRISSNTSSLPIEEAASKRSSEIEAPREHGRMDELIIDHDTAITTNRQRPKDGQN